MQIFIPRQKLGNCGEMGSSRKLFLPMGILFVLLFLLSSDQVAPSNAQTKMSAEHVDKKNGKVVHLPNTGGQDPEKYSGQVVYKRPLNPGSIVPKKCNIYGQCLPRRPILPKPRKCEYANLCNRPCCGKAQEFRKDQFKDDFHN